MKPYSAIFFSQGQYRHLTADSVQEARQLLLDFTIDRLVEPIGVYNALTDRFFCYPAQPRTFPNVVARSAGSVLWVHIDRLRKQEPASAPTPPQPAEFSTAY